MLNIRKNSIGNEKSDGKYTLFEIEETRKFLLEPNRPQHALPVKIDFIFYTKFLNFYKFIVWQVQITATAKLMRYDVLSLVSYSVPNQCNVKLKELEPQNEHHLYFCRR